MKAITIVQPLAHLFRKGLKNMKVMAEDTEYRGPVAIVAGDTSLPIYQFRSVALLLMYDNDVHPERSVIAIGKLKSVRPVVDVVHKMSRSERKTNEDKRIESSYGKYAYFIYDVQPISALPVGDTDIGASGLWDLPDELNAQVEGADAQLKNINRGKDSQKHTGTDTRVSRTPDPVAGGSPD